MIEIIPAAKNLGCLALKVGELFYIDTFKDTNRGFFCRIEKVGRFWFFPWRLNLRYEGRFFLQLRPFEKQFKMVYYRSWN